eukprot:jgi/Mesen1/3291/ME000191S02433
MVEGGREGLLQPLRPFFPPPKCNRALLTIACWSAPFRPPSPHPGGRAASSATDDGMNVRFYYCHYPCCSTPQALLAWPPGIVVACALFTVGGPDPTASLPGCPPVCLSVCMPYTPLLFSHLPSFLLFS